MKLIKGKRYYCGWACRLATYEKTVKGVAKFVDVCGEIIECEVEYLEKWVKEA